MGPGAQLSRARLSGAQLYRAQFSWNLNIMVGCHHKHLYLLDAGHHLHHVAKHRGQVVLRHLVPGEIPKLCGIGVRWEVAEPVTVSWDFSKLRCSGKPLTMLFAHPCILYLYVDTGSLKYHTNVSSRSHPGSFPARHRSQSQRAEMRGCARGRSPPARGNCSCHR